MSLDGPYDPDNIFAKILRGELPCVKVYEDESVLAFMDIFPQAPGHVLVVPKEAARNALEMSDDGLAAAMLRVKRIGKAVKAALAPDGIMIAQLNGAPAGQTVFHVHFHIIPRSDGAQLGMHAGGKADMDALTAQAKKIASFLD
ncbi:HIT family protein [uncultured Maricaulis sp.]|uniref:HIT family protein n=1 Tax=uncultured Maricaulis sp. TaxID=174710 RepID=UPI0030DD7E9D|tara:strand:- start:35776 stop:36207 length:432 start_codon:yes stop_codon:yes gene_type:complete